MRPPPGYKLCCCLLICMRYYDFHSMAQFLSPIQITMAHSLSCGGDFGVLCRYRTTDMAENEDATEYNLCVFVGRWIVMVESAT